MKGKDLIKLLKGYEDFDVDFVFRDESGVDEWPSYRSFTDLELGDIGHSDKRILLTSNDEKL